MTDNEIARLIDTLFLKNDKLWHFTTAELSQFIKEAIAIHKEIKAESESRL